MAPITYVIHFLKMWLWLFVVGFVFQNPRFQWYFLFGCCACVGGPPSPFLEVPYAQVVLPRMAPITFVIHFVKMLLWLFVVGFVFQNPKSLSYFLFCCCACVGGPPPLPHVLEVQMAPITFIILFLNCCSDCLLLVLFFKILGPCRISCFVAVLVLAAPPIPHFLEVP